jgi:hypothetical protein
MAKRDLYSLLGQSGDGVLKSIKAQAIAATTNGTAADMAPSSTLPGSESLVCIADAGTCTDGKYTVSLEESDDNSTFTAVAAADLQGSFTQINAAADETIEVVGYIGDKRYVRAKITEDSAGVTGVIISVCLVRGHPKHLGIDLMS